MKLLKLKISFYKIFLYYSVFLSSILVAGGLYGARSAKEFAAILLFLPIPIFLWLMLIMVRKIQNAASSGKLSNDLSGDSFGQKSDTLSSRERTEILQNNDENNAKSDLNTKNDLESDILSDQVGDPGKRLFIKALGAVGLSAAIFSIFSKKAQALVLGSAPATSVVGLKDSSNARVDPATIDDNFLAGSGVSSSVTLTLANTAYAVPATASVKNHTLILYNGSDTDQYVNFENANSNGILLPVGGVMTLDLGADQQVYAYCASAGKVITYSYKEQD